MSDLPNPRRSVAEPARELKPLEDHLAELAAKADPPTPSGVACSDFVREPEVRKRIRKVSRQEVVELEPFVNPKTFEVTPRSGVQDVLDEEEVEEIVEVNVAPCPGELMYDEPRQSHPQLKMLARARCSVCGWRGWV